MKICYLTTYYPPFINALCLKYDNFTKLNYEQSLKLILSELYADTGAIHYYSLKYGNDSFIIIQNFEILQKKWASENNVVYTDINWLEVIAIEQIKKYKVDFFYTESINSHSNYFFIEIKKNVKKIFAWISFPFKDLPNLKYIDIIFTSTKYYQTKFKNMGLVSEYMLPAFDCRVLDKLKSNQKSIQFSFLGGISDIHKNRWEALNYLAKNTDINIFGYGLPNLSGNIFKQLFKKDKFSLIRKKHFGEIWGIEMYETLKKSLITFNIHEALLNGDVGNMRMFEATGVGTALLNDFGNNINELFIEDKEIIVYNNLEEALEKLNYYLKNPDLALEIGINSQKRTLRDYNYINYTNQMMDFIQKNV
jgi:spore maturation protein CgeB